MSASHQREAAIFDAAMELPPAQRAAYLEQACAGDTALRQRIESLLSADESKCDFLDSPAHPATAAPTLVPPLQKPGDTIGRYKLREQIGEGGCGVVYVAEQTEPVRRRVALKIIKLGMDTKSVIARFEAERQALALMDHPNIAKVFDAGATETGRPYFVMELVRGMKITDYCDEQKLSTRERLDLFIRVCQAIQHAHQKGIIHRDIKPSNILVTVNDGVPVPKVIDFGVAKATSGQQLTDKTIYTAFEQFIGTPAYMSPEQAVLTSLDIDTRSDIYALGVLLYELLTGKTPFDAKELFAIGLDEMRRTIREQEPPRPSTRLTDLVAADVRRLTSKSEIENPKSEIERASSRRLLQEKERLVSELRGDLDWIVMKALEKDRARRYETANGLAADVQRHLNNEPVVACPPSRLYRLRKTVRRNKLAFTAAGAMAASLAVGLTLATASFFRERAARERADEQTAIAKAVNDFLQTDLLRQVSSRSQADRHFTPDPNLTVREALERASERIGDRFKDRPLQEAAVRMAIGSAFNGVGESERAVAHLQRAMEMFRARLGPDHPSTLDSMANLARAYGGGGMLDQCLSLHEETLKRRKATLGLDHRDTLKTMNDLATAYSEAGKLNQTLPLQQETLIRRRATLGPDHPDTLDSMNSLAWAYYYAGNVDQALALGEESLKRRKAVLGPNHPDTLESMSSMASFYALAGKFDQALPLQEKVLDLQKAKVGPDHPATLWSMNNLTIEYAQAGQHDQALALAEETLKRRKASLGPSHPHTLESMLIVGRLYNTRHRFDLGLPLLEQTLELQKVRLGPDHPGTLETMIWLAVDYRSVGKFDQALPLLEEAVKLRKARQQPDHRDHLPLPLVMDELANAYRKVGKLAQLEAMYREQLAQQSNGLTVRFELGRLLLEVAKADAVQRQDLVREGEQLLRDYLAGARSRYTNEPLKLAERLQDAAEPFYRQGNYAEAEPLYRQIIELRRPRLNADDANMLEPTASLARLLTDWAWAERDSKSNSRNPLATAERNGVGKSEIAERAYEAERLLRAVLSVRLRDSTNSWRTGDVKSRLGGALVSIAVTDPALDAESRQAKLSAAESLLLEGCEQAQSGAPDDKYIRDAIQRLVRLYEAWDKPERVAEWQQKLELFDATQQKSSASKSDAAAAETK